PRCVYKGYDGRIYAGGFETIGYIDRTNPADPTFVRIGEDLLKGTEEEIWHISGNENQNMFQSFSLMIFQDSNGLELYQPQDNIMFGKWIGNRLYVPQIEQGLYVFEEGREWTITPNKIPQNAIVSGLDSYEQNRLLIATRNSGLFIVDSTDATPINGDLNEQLKTFQINDLLLLQNGDYAIGTIQNGVYLTDSLLRIKYHLNKTNGLANNSVLSLYQTRKGALCIGLNIGMSILKVNESARYYHDIEGKLGSVFATMYFQEKFYVGTNQGVFVQDERGEYHLVPGSQGQVWSLIQAGDDLLCGHNSGTLQFIDGRFEQVCSITGGFHMQLLNDSQLLQSTYTGLILLEERKGRWQDAARIRGTDKLIDRFIYQSGEVVGLHPYFGLVYYKLDLSQNRMIYRKIFHNWESKIGTNSLGLIELENQIYVQTDTTFHQIGDYGAMSQVSASQVNEITRKYPDLPYRILKPINNNSEQNRMISYFAEKNLVIRSIQEGYVKEPALPIYRNATPPGLQVEYLMTNGELRTTQESHLDLQPQEQNLSIQLSPTEGFLHDVSNLKYRLKGYDLSWQDLPQNGQLEFKQLDHGQYELQIKVTDDPPHSLLRFDIAPYWYESWPGIILYTAVVCFVFWSINQRNKRQLKLETQRLKQEKEAALDAERIRAKTEKLEHEVAYKSKMLANSAMTMVQKNNMLNELKEVIKNESSHTDSVQAVRGKLLKLIDRNLNSDESWEIFDRNFAEVHQDFIERFKAAHPEITPGDLRLAAYIRMNLSSKEIAPL
ncbi:MAG: triple tyrosine motif-containing protein, partial [Sphaerochaetaceae bacterium]